MKIMVINPVSTDVWDQKDREYLEEMAFKDTELEVVSLPAGPESIETYYDEAIASPEILKIVEKAEGYSAIIINCFADPGLYACREKSRTLILGAGETAMTTATLLGNKFAVLSIMNNARGQFETAARRMGLSDRLAYVAGIDTPVLEIENSPETEKQLLEEAETALRIGAEVIVLGCTGLFGFADILRKNLSCTVVEPAAVTFKIAEALGSIGLAQSKTGMYMDL
ncbi:hydantoin racemase [bacterium]|nr:hydantoin racemase [bacterium]